MTPPSLREAVTTGFNMETDWNRTMFVAGYHAGYLRVPPLRYRTLRAVHLTQLALREHVALAIAPWLEQE